MNCQYCKRMLPGNTRDCPSCGAPILQATNANTNDRSFAFYAAQAMPMEDAVKFLSRSPGPINYTDWIRTQVGNYIEALERG